MSCFSLPPRAVPPKWIKEPQDVHGVVGQDIVLACDVEGFPRPTTLWTRANGLLFERSLSSLMNNFQTLEDLRPMI
jgi:hypothetical protein